MRRLLRSYFLIVGNTAFADSRSQFHLKQESTIDLIRESEAVSVVKEQSIQVKRSENLRHFKIGMSYFQAGFVEMLSASEHATRYELTEPLVQPQVHYKGFFLGSSHDVGWEMGLGYSTIDGGVGLIKTRLHIIPIYLGAAYRWQKSPTSPLALSAGLGPVSIITAQWGPSAYTTTDSEWVARATLGLDFNLNNVFGWDRYVEYTFGVEGQFMFAQKDFESNWNGRSMTATLGMVL